MKKFTLSKSPLFISVVQLGLLVFAVYYTFIGGQTAQGIYDHTWRLITLYLAAVIIGGWLLWRLFGRTKIPRTPLDIPLLFVFTSWLLAIIFSINVIYSQETVVFLLTYLFFSTLPLTLGVGPGLKNWRLTLLLAVPGWSGCWRCCNFGDGIRITQPVGI